MRSAASTRPLRSRLISNGCMSAQELESLPLLQNDTRHLGVTSAIFLIVNRIIGTGIFSIPSGVYQQTGSLGWSLVLWILGGIVAFCGFSVYFEYGLEMPQSGGEKNYLMRLFPRPKYLVLAIFATTAVVLGFSTSNSYAFGLYVQMVFGVEHPSEYLARYYGCAVMVFTVILHGYFPRTGRVVFNVLGFVKVLILIFIALCGILVLTGLLSVPGGRQTQNFHNMFENDGFGGGLYNYAVAFLRISYSYRGWETPNMVMGEVKNPAKTLGRAGPLALLTITGLYLLCNLAYFLVIPKHEIANSGVVIAGMFFLRLFGETATGRLLPLFICLSNIGNVLVVTYAMARVNAELASHHILPFSSIISSTKPWGTPLAGLLIHMTMTFVTLLVPPPGQVYDFVVDLSTYPVVCYGVLITGGLLYLHRYPEANNWGLKDSKWHSPLPLTLIFFTFNLGMMVFTWVPPKEHDPTKFPYYASPLGSLIVFSLGTLYWSWWRKTPSARKLDAEIDAGEYLAL